MEELFERGWRSVIEEAREIAGDGPARVCGVAHEKRPAPKSVGSPDPRVRGGAGPCRGCAGQAGAGGWDVIDRSAMRSGVGSREMRFFRITRDTGRYLRTIRHLRGRQAAYQILHRLRYERSGPRHVPGRGPMPAPRWPDGAGVFPLAGGAEAANEPARVRSGSLTFLNRAESVGFPPDWNATEFPRLWLYHLHYHEYLHRLPFRMARDVVLDWIVRHRPGPGRVGWEPYPVSRRIANWCTYFLGRERSRTHADDAFRDTLWASLCEQADHLQRRPEWHLLGNHLLEDAVALSLIGSCFDHPAAGAWFSVGRAILARELPEQILADGGHFERSPMYHSRVLEALLLLDATGDHVLQTLVQPYLPRLADSLTDMVHPDGGIALLNDSAFGVYPPPLALTAAAGAEPPRVGTFALDKTGYYGARTSEGHYVICDAGPLGPDYQPGHGHADLFSFELSLYGARVVVDSGVSTYESDPMREYCRSTRAHNTVEIEGRDQAELWATFRVGRRPHPEAVQWEADGGGFRLSGRHAGYRQLPGGPIHTRTFRWQREGKLEIRDHVEATRAVRSVARLHFHPECRLGDFGGEGCALNFPGGYARIHWSGWETVARDDGSFYCPEFGVARPNPCLALSSTVDRLAGTICIEPQ